MSTQHANSRADVAQQPVLVAHAERDDETIGQALGRSEYSYYFVLRTFKPILAQLGALVTASNETERTDSDGRGSRRYDTTGQVEAIYEICRHLDRPCVFLAFAPPHRTPVDLACPTIPVFAWEFPDLPSESWGSDPRDDWRFGLAKAGCAITHSEFAARVIRAAMGADFPVAAIPAPVWDRFASLCSPDGARPAIARRTITGVTAVIDTGTAAVRGTALATRATATIEFDEARREAARGVATRGIGSASVRGVVYTTVLNPIDGRKNWREILRAFCLALGDHDDATLFIKLIGSFADVRNKIGVELARLRPFRCRVVASDSFLADTDYSCLAKATTYPVNASSGEGQCLPLMEHMSAGRPAIAPRHTGMEDYVDDTNAFVVETSLEPAAWPHDPRQVYRTSCHRLNMESLMDAFRRSYRVAHEDPDLYQAMSRSARERLRAHCCEAIISSRLARFLADRIQS